ncbi:MAG: hypothetical protein ACTHML_12640 [Ginsengibacter sp.]
MLLYSVSIHVGVVNVPLPPAEPEAPPQERLLPVAERATGVAFRQ